MPDSVEKALGRIETLVDLIKEDVEEVKDLVREQNGRVRTLEINSAHSSGAWKLAGILGGIAGGIASLIPRFWGS